MSREQFDAVVKKMRAWFTQRARGPAVQTLLDTYVKDQVEADVVFLEHSHSVCVAWRSSGYCQCCVSYRFVCD